MIYLLIERLLPIVVVVSDRKIRENLSEISDGHVECTIGCTEGKLRNLSFVL